MLCPGTNNNNKSALFFPNPSPVRLAISRIFSEKTALYRRANSGSSGETKRHLMSSCLWLATAGKAGANVKRKTMLPNEVIVNCTPLISRSTASPCTE